MATTLGQADALTVVGDYEPEKAMDYTLAAGGGVRVRAAHTHTHKDLPFLSFPLWLRQSVASRARIAPKLPATTSF